MDTNKIVNELILGLGSEQEITDEQEIIIEALSIDYLTNALSNIKTGNTVIVEVSDNTISQDDAMAYLSLLNPPVNLIIRKAL